MPMTNDNEKRELTYENEEGVEVTVELAQKWEICGDCRGNGTHDHPAFANGVEQDILDDEDSRTSYFRGDYDVRCDYCDGEGKVLMVDFEALANMPEGKEIEDALNREYDSQAESDAERDAERRAGC
jgi:hypothetical protein